MAFTDQNLYCRDCNQEFVFTAGEQEFYESRGLVNAPSRCPSCRAARKGQSNNYGGNRRGDFRDREPRQMYTATCASVGMRRRCLSCHEKTGLYIAVIVTSRKALVAQMTADHAGNPHE